MAAVLRRGEPMDKSQVALPTSRPTVWDSLTLLTTPDTAKHVADVSPAHTVASLDVKPSLI
jgi:hypothetical protein